VACGCNERLKGDLAVFYRVYQKGGTNQTALVLLKKGNQTTRISVSDYLEPGEWRDAFTGGKRACGIAWRWTCPPIASAYSCWDQPLTRENTRQRLAELMARNSP
jgi:cyclomaltodextrin glucanotransferase